MVVNMETGDELIDIKNSFFTGNYQVCVNECQKHKLQDSSLAVEKDIFMYRSYIALKKYRVVLDEISSSSPDLIQPLKTLATFLANPERRESMVVDLDNMMSGNLDVNNYVLLLVAGTIYLHAGQPESALKILHSSEHIECLALKVQALLSMNRPDLARKEMKNLVEKDEDATITQLAQAWTNLHLGSDKIQEAYYIYKDLLDKYGNTCLLLNGSAACSIAEGKYVEAEASLNDGLQEDPNNTDILVNLLVNSQFMGKPQEVSNRYMSQLKDMDPKHPFLVSVALKEADFDRMCKQYAI
ncbi:coatomer subunit epsilon [Eurytemora carolleeae]|uniref:coatomer subunit epsilon n=1 Tax=Eurytemora carolleeae TaxID=1294199 RepID=UPI000C77A4C0|nr:coatomer subunit epsilon [Eurytemora carolleeae]|eukprot:XP_023336675.1 coatomer subunit epsilon-like [Eurytemora affinis]